MWCIERRVVPSKVPSRVDTTDQRPGGIFSCAVAFYREHQLFSTGSDMSNKPVLLGVLIALAIIAGGVLLYRSLEPITPREAVITSYKSLLIYASEHGDSIVSVPDSLLPHAPDLTVTLHPTDFHTTIVTARNRTGQVCSIEVGATGKRGDPAPVCSGPVTR